VHEAGALAIGSPPETAEITAPVSNRMSVLIAASRALSSAKPLASLMNTATS
jgi:hypothetical protein